MRQKGMNLAPPTRKAMRSECTRRNLPTSASRTPSIGATALTDFLTILRDGGSGGVHAPVYDRPFLMSYCGLKKKNQNDISYFFKSKSLIKKKYLSCIFLLKAMTLFC
jgi:hypothetical protein